MQPISLPTLGYFKNGNGWLGSSGVMRFQIITELPEKPEGAVDAPEGGTMTAVLWQGPFSRPYAQEIERETFPVSGEGLAALIGYLTAKAETMAQAPVFTQAETTAHYRSIKARELSGQEG